MTEARIGDWVAWNGRGEPPTGRVRVQRYSASRKTAELRPAQNAHDLVWVGGPNNQRIVYYQLCSEPVRGELVLYGGLHTGWNGGKGVEDTHIITIPILDGELPLGDVAVKIERLK